MERWIDRNYDNMKKNNTRFKLWLSCVSRSNFIPTLIRSDDLGMSSREKSEWNAVKHLNNFLNPYIFTSSYE